MHHIEWALRNRHKEEESCDKDCRGCEWCSDAYGVDAIKDANAEMGLDPYNHAGVVEARRRGWLRSKYPRDE